jgi:hypothetical protein
VRKAGEVFGHRNDTNMVVHTGYEYVSVLDLCSKRIKSKTRYCLGIMDVVVLKLLWVMTSIGN